jgi:hypothetical protein
MDTYKANGYVLIDGERRYYRRHISDHLVEGFNKLTEKFSEPGERVDEGELVIINLFEVIMQEIHHNKIN